MKYMLLAVSLLMSVNVFATTCREVLLPGYIYPSQWIANDLDKLLFAGKTTGKEIVVLNPSSGPGTTVNPDYVAQIAKFRSDPDTANVRLIAYVSTSWGDRQLQDVLDDMEMYVTLYGDVWDGYFFDEMETDIVDFDYYDTLASYVYNPYLSNRVMVFNPGTYPDYGYMALKTNNGYTGTERLIFVTFEGSWNDYQNITVPSAWLSAPTNTQSHMVYDVASTNRIAATSLSKTLRAGYVYFTNDTLLPDSPYNTLTTYNSALVTALKAECGQ